MDLLHLEVDLVEDEVKVGHRQVECLVAERQVLLDLRLIVRKSPHYWAPPTWINQSTIVALMVELTALPFSQPRSNQLKYRANRGGWWQIC